MELFYIAQYVEKHFLELVNQDVYIVMIQIVKGNERITIKMHVSKGRKLQQRKQTKTPLILTRTNGVFFYALYISNDKRHIAFHLH